MRDLVALGNDAVQDTHLLDVLDVLSASVLKGLKL